MPRSSMKASSGSSRSATTTDRVQTPADGGLSLDDGETAPAASAKTLQCKEALLSSSDTDDGDAPYSKLVIDLDASGAAPDPPPADSKLPTASASSSTVPEAAPMSALSSTSSRSDGAKSRAQNSTVDGTKTASASHRSSKPHSAELSNGAQKGLKMKIRCSQSGGGGQRHEVSHFHPVVGSPPPPPASGQATVAGHSLKAGGLEKGRSSGSHRRDRQLTKDRAKDHAKDRTPSDKHHAGAAGDVAAGPSAVVVVSRDVSLDASKSLNADGMDRDRDRDPSSAVLPPLTHDPYEFNASSEDSISCPTKKMKFEQV